MSEEENEEKEEENDIEKNIDINLNKNKGIDNTMETFPINENQKSISQILSEVDFEMNSLSNQIDNQFLYTNYKTFHNNNIENLIKSKDSTKIIDNENLREINLIQNSLDNDILFNKLIQGSPNNFDKYFNQSKNNLYESYKNSNYYSSFNLNSNNIFNTYPNLYTNLSSKRKTFFK